ncbi:hypothetical protein Y11_17491 [Yersinia enterocolitica subsp. palearctica Y11]|uniref:Uncharacterized protein n=1 Tax=Yersinia enterocolitica subsp. palearctica serotype O:3 (strain DSM 13030 / CIP 106945 / Y11) TaxID=930944 RepID=A0A0H3NPU4_YERE1|nr:hypothetical protein Y11_17491 [Yersinia enterocolitica subsp. palearctica Y11]CCO69354.1 hypothetical protein D322_2480 [Yersinia enterocolitica IP 10393]
MDYPLLLILWSNCNANRAGHGDPFLSFRVQYEKIVPEMQLI